MGVRVQYLDGCMGVLYGPTGKLLGSELVEADLNRLARRDLLLRQRYHISDLRGVDELAVRAPDIDRMLEVEKRIFELIPKGAVAVVATRDAAFGLARMWESLAATHTPWDTLVTKDWGEAERWVRAKVEELFGFTPTFTPCEPPAAPKAG